MATNEPIVMATLNNTEAGQPSSAGREPSQLAGRRPRFPIFQLEEQTLAELSAARAGWIWWESRDLRRRQRRKQARQLANRTHEQRRKLPESYPGLLSVELGTPSNIGPEDGGEMSNESTRRETVERGWLDPEPKLNWSEESRGNLLGAVFWGYVALQIPFARGAEIIGAKTLLLICGFGSGLTSILFVFAVRLFGDAIWCPYLLRLLMGVSQAGLFPAMYVLYSRWLPASERSYLLPVPSALSRFGIIALNFVVPYVMSLYGWPMVFMLSGAITIAWATMLLVFASSRPGSNRWLPTNELLYINTRMKSEAASTAKLAPMISTSSSINDICFEPEPASKSTPSNSIDWLKLMLNRPVAMLIVVMLSSEWSNLMLIVQLPTFLKQGLQMNLAEVSDWNIMLISLYCLAFPLSGAVASKMAKVKSVKLSTLAIRKLFEASAQLLQATGALIIALYSDKTIILIGLLVAMTGRSLVGGGQCLLPPELSREYPGTVMAYANAIANLACAIGPTITGKVLPETGATYEDWRIIWFASACVSLASGLLFVLLADNSPQDLSKDSLKAKAISKIKLVEPAFNLSALPSELSKKRQPL